MKDKNHQLTELLLRFHEFDVSKYDEMFLNKALEAKIAEKNLKSEEEYYELLNHSDEEVHDFIQSLSISYSEFFRNPLTFSVLEKIVLPSIIYKNDETNRKEIRVWSAACASGQETYSVVILLRENSLNANINYRIFATDSSENQIEKAQIGSYYLHDLSQLSARRLDKWFVKNKDIYSVKPDLKHKVEFSIFDLLDKDH